MSRLTSVAGVSLICAFALTTLPASGVAQNFRRAPTVVGTKIADGQAYATVVVLEHQKNPSDNGRMLLAFEGNGGIPIYESTDHGASWHFVADAKDSTGVDPSRCRLQWQPHLQEMPRTQFGIQAGTILLSASTVCRPVGSNFGRQEMYLRLFTSNDFGRSWDYRSTYAESKDGLPVWEPHLLILDDGTFVEFYSDETHKAEGYNQLLAHKVSKDGGKTWGNEILDTAVPGGVERPGMVIIARLPDGRYIYSYEDVDGPVPNQVHVKFSRDGLNWGNPAARGTPVQSMSGQYPENTPNVFWFPIGGKKGTLVVTSRSTGGPAADAAGNTLFWNNDLGEGPWWTAPTPVQKIGNSRAGWTQAMVLLPDGKLLHITSSGTPDTAAAAGPRRGPGNQILFNADSIDFNRYEAESAGQQGTAVMRDRSMSNGAKARLGAKDVGKLTFDVYVADAGPHALSVEYTDIGFEAVPRLDVNGQAVTGTVAEAPIPPERAAQAARDLGTRSSGKHMIFSAVANLMAGNNRIEIKGGAYALDVDYLEVVPASR